VKHRRPHRASPRSLSLALDQLGQRLAPTTPLARAQSAWPAVVGDTIAHAAHPIAERQGVLTVTCSSAVWANELDLMAPEVIARLNEALGGLSIHALRCRAG
jgi:predicted nucleic acid-binding Zn ribbon protein